ncbi:hypothetical protein EJ08DRAFT_731634 [Tothia fuscella]|uniref:DUF7707 domain-containing protein n=1 Tax=Tothia fuscella TaxID=1048955 RepID=A0A9P4NVX5_9PEZI|nr:hypothetical protein EJ08DRAFT_731634 [Tothia fuscella]
MLYRNFLACVSAVAGIVFAQANTTAGGTPGDFTACCSILPNSIKPELRLSWCRAQQNTCPETCPNGQTSKNDCDPNTLTYNCQCLNNPTGNISDYAQTLPSLQCDEWKGQCVQSHPNDLAGQTFCQSFTCGKKNATALVGGSRGGSSSSSAAAASSGASSTATSSGGAASTSKSAAMVLRVGREYGTGAVAVGLLAIFGLAL